MQHAERAHVVRPSLAWEAFPGEIVAIDLERGTYFHLEGGAMEVFQVLLGPATLADVQARVAPRFAADESAVHAAVAEVYGALAERTLIVPTDAASAPGPLPDLAVPAPFAGFALDVHEDLQELIFVDPVHDTSEAGWPAKRA